ncbi:MAG: FAD-dependent thymidylate synthase, partial [Thermoleophilia bacterium]|nr:FAD-dependent thymidylate synthase [Thermoleophilia bacterium]
IDDDGIAAEALELLESTQRHAFDSYEKMLELGVAKEVARVVLPVGTYSRFKWGCNLRSLLSFLQLRNHSHAQYEIREFAQAIEELARPVCPVAFELFEEHGRVAP